MTDEAQPDSQSQSVGVNIGRENTIQVNGNIIGGDFISGDKIILAEEQAYRVHDLPNPYLGLRSFTYEDRTAFAGRDAAIRHTVNKLTQPGAEISLLFVTGASGSGKSSFAQAGLLPALESYYQQRNKTPRRAVFRPSGCPLAGLSDALAQLGLPQQSVVVLGSIATSDFTQWLCENTPAGQVNLLVLDQFEEFFTHSPPDQRRQAFALLQDLPDFPTGHTHLIATLRSDYLDELFNYPILWEQTKNGAELRAMNADELKAAIQGPLEARMAQDERYRTRRFQPELHARLAEDAAEDAAYLPLLQVTLEELWKGGELTLGRYTGLADAIRQRAETVYRFQDYDSTSPIQPRPAGDQAALMNLLLDLVDVAPDDDPRRDVRRRRRKSDLTGDSAQRINLVEDLTVARLLSAGSETTDGILVDTIDITHEALIHNWKRLGEAIAEQRQRLQVRARFELSLAEWLEQGQSADYLLSGVYLAEARQLANEGDIALRSKAARLFIQNGIEQAEAAQRREIERTRRWSFYLSVALVFTFLAALVAISFWRSADQTSRDNARLAEENATVAAKAQAERDLAATQESRALQAEAEAQEQARLARAEEFAALSQVAIESFPNRALLLIIEASMLTPKRLPDIEQVLRDALRINGGIPLGGNKGPIYSLVFSPDGRWLATGGDDKIVRLWDMQNIAGGPTLLTGHNGAIWSLAFSPDGRWLASGSYDTTIRLWDMQNITASPTILNEHNDAIRNLDFDPDGKWLVTGSKDGTAYLWNLKNLTAKPLLLIKKEGVFFAMQFSPDGRWLAASNSENAIAWDMHNFSAKPFMLHGYTSPINTLAFSFDGGLLATGGSDGTVCVWNTDNLNAEPTLLNGHENEISILTFSPDGDWLATGSVDQTARLWNLRNLADAPIVLRGHTGWISILAFNPDGGWLATGSVDKTVRLWDLSDPTNEPAVLHGHDDALTRLAFSIDGRWLATTSTDGATRLWDMQSSIPASTPRLAEPASNTAHPGNIETAITEPVILRGHEDGINTLAFSPDNRWLATGSDDTTARLWNFKDPTSQPVVLSGHKEGIRKLAYDSQGRWLATASIDFTIHLWDMQDIDTKPLVMQGHEAPVNAIAFSPNSDWLVSGSWDNTARLWNLIDPSGQAIVLRGHQDGISTLAFSPDGQRLATGSYDSTVRLWNLPNPSAESIVLNSEKGEVLTLAFSLDGHWLATGRKDNTVLLWNMGAPAADPIVLLGHQGPITTLAFSPDARWLATGSADKTTRLWDVRDPAKVPVILRGHDNQITTLAFSPDTHWLVTGSYDRTARVWDINSPTAKPVILYGYDNPPNAIAFSPDGQWLATNDYASIRLWRTNISDLLDLACQIVGRNLTQAEWAQYFPGVPYHKTCDQWPEGQ